MGVGTQEAQVFVGVGAQDVQVLAGGSDHQACEMESTFSMCTRTVEEVTSEVMEGREDALVSRAGEREVELVELYILRMYGEPRLIGRKVERVRRYRVFMLIFCLCSGTNEAIVL